MSSPNPIEAETKIQQPEQTTTPAPNVSSFKAFYSTFTKDERKKFLDNIAHHFKLIITRNMRKMKEANQRLKASIR